MIALCNVREFQADALINPYERCSKELRPYGIKLNHKIEVQGEGSRQSNFRLLRNIDAKTSKKESGTIREDIIYKL